MDVFISNVNNFCFVLFLSIILFPIFSWKTPVYLFHLSSLTLGLNWFSLSSETLFHYPRNKRLINLDRLFVVAGNSQNWGFTVMTPLSLS